MRNRVDETRDEFLDRCMLDPDTRSEIPHLVDRFRYCVSCYTPILAEMDPPVKKGG